jgi:quercetin dioxygenase-like cupin family protein
VRRVSRGIATGIAIAILAAASGRGRAQQAGLPVKRTVLLKQDTTVPDCEAVMASVELPPRSTEGRHTHPAEVYGFVQEGTVTLEVEGMPTRSLKAGDVFTIAPGKIHQGSNNGAATARLSVVFFAEKGKPLTTPAP